MKTFSIEKNAFQTCHQINREYLKWSLSYYWIMDISFHQLARTWWTQDTLSQHIYLTHAISLSETSCGWNSVNFNSSIFLHLPTSSSNSDAHLQFLSSSVSSIFTYVFQLHDVLVLGLQEIICPELFRQDFCKFDNRDDHLQKKSFTYENRIARKQSFSRHVSTVFNDTQLLNREFFL